MVDRLYYINAVCLELYPEGYKWGPMMSSYGLRELIDTLRTHLWVKENLNNILVWNVNVIEDFSKICIWKWINPLNLFGITRFMMLYWWKDCLHADEKS